MTMLQQMSVQQHVPAAAAHAVDEGMGFLLQVAGKRQRLQQQQHRMLRFSYGSQQSGCFLQHSASDFEQ